MILFNDGIASLQFLKGDHHYTAEQALADFKVSC